MPRKIVHAKPAAPDRSPLSSEAATPAPAGRPSWSGLLRLSLVALPVKGYPAVTTAANPSFHQLHAGCGQRIRHEKRCPCHGPVDAAAIVRGYGYGPDQYIPVEAEELERFRPAQDKALVLEQFVAGTAIDPVFYAGRSLYLLPDGAAACQPYGVMSTALARAGKVGLGRMVLSGRRQLVAVRACGRRLVLDVLYYPAQIRAAADAAVVGVATAEEVRLAGQLIAAAGTPLDWSRFRDTNSEELRALLEAKIEARLPAAGAAANPELLPMLEALKRSVAAAVGRQTRPQETP